MGIVVLMVKKRTHPSKSGKLAKIRVRIPGGANIIKYFKRKNK